MTPIRRSRDIGAPRPHRRSDQPAGGARHRIEGGPTTPAGIPVISAARLREAGYDELAPIVPADATVTDRLPVVGGKFDPGARHRLSDTAFSIHDNGPDTDELPIITAPGPAWANLEHPTPGYDAPATRHPLPTPEHRGADTFPPRPAPDHHGADSFPRSTPDYPDTDTFSALAVPGSDGTDSASSRPAPDYHGNDEVFARMIDRSRRRRVPRWFAPLVASVAGAVLIGGTYVQLRGPAPTSTASSTALVPSSVSPVTAECPTEQIGAMVRGNNAGGTESGIAAIMAFQYAYYVARSGDQARTLVASGAVAPSAAAIQAGIDSTPVGTTHCVEITPGAYVDQYLVKVTAFRPDSAPSTYTPQLVETAQVGSKTLITSFGAAPR
ncbi:hypothetical protein [Nocardia alba]|uniref:hypothetical protein n=1 Tax=Nocardia alba TaxID=225051 RepID=UPI00082C16F8|nr:hypothetical protein [Nocardia alba]